MNMARQPKCSVTPATIGAAAAAPRAVPELKIPTAMARSRTGNHSVTVLTQAGMLAASAAPSRNRQNENCRALRARVCNASTPDQARTKAANPRRVPTKSISRPLTAYMRV